MLYLVQGFSPQMLSDDLTLEFTKITDSVAKKLLLEQYTSAVPFRDMAGLISQELGMEIQPSKLGTSLVLRDGDALLIAHYSGPKIYKGAIQKPVGGQLTFWHVTVFEE